MTVYMENTNPEVYIKLNVPVLDDPMATAKCDGKRKQHLRVA